MYALTVFHNGFKRFQRIQIFGETLQQLYFYSVIKLEATLVLTFQEYSLLKLSSLVYFATLPQIFALKNYHPIEYESLLISSKFFFFQRVRQLKNTVFNCFVYFATS